MFIYMGGRLAGQLTGLAVLPVLTRYITPAEYGYVAMFAAVLSFLGPVVCMSLNTHITRNYFKKQKPEMAEISTNALYGIALNFAVVAGLCLATVSYAELIFGLPPFWVVAAAVLAAVNGVGTQYTSFLRVMGKAAQYAVVEYGGAVVSLGLSVYLVAYLGWGWTGRAWGVVISGMLMGGFGLAMLRRTGFLRGRLRWPLLRTLYGISLPLVPHSVSLKIINLNSRFFVDRLVGKEALGLYSTGHAFASVVGMVTQAFNAAWTPWVYQRLARKTAAADLQIVRLIYVVVIGLLGVWGGAWLLLPLVIQLMTAEAYHGAAKFAVWVALAFVFEGIYSLLLPMIVDAGKTGALATFTGATAVLSLALNLVLVTRFDAMGAAYTAVACAGVKTALVFRHANRVRPMPWLATAVFRKAAGP